MKVLVDTGGVASTNSWLIADEAAKVAAIFDAPDHTMRGLVDTAKKNGWDVIGLWLTHGHFDHVADHEVVTRAFPSAKVLIHHLDEPKLKDPNRSPFMLPFVIPPRSADGYVTDGQMLKIGALEVQVLHTPGHCAGHVNYYIASEKVIVGGDLIIGGAVGRTDLPDSDERELYRSIQRVMALPGDTRLLPGHGDMSTLDEERAENPYVRMALGM